jgi:hypothetical protein
MLNTLRQTYSSQPVSNENGTAIVAALLILLLLTFVAITATDTTITEKAAVRSEAIFEQDFYLAESAALEGIQKMENQDDPEELLAPLIESGAENEGLLASEDTSAEEGDDKDQVATDVDGDTVIEDDEIAASMDPSELDADTYRMVVQRPIASGSSLGMGSSRLYEYTSYGYSMANDGRAMINIGYKKRF